jgi:hypothetical protein
VSKNHVHRRLLIADTNNCYIKPKLIPSSIDLRSRNCKIFGCGDESDGDDNLGGRFWEFFRHDKRIFGYRAVSGAVDDEEISCAPAGRFRRSKSLILRSTNGREGFLRRKWRRSMWKSSVVGESDVNRRRRIVKKRSDRRWRPSHEKLSPPVGRPTPLVVRSDRLAGGGKFSG